MQAGPMIELLRDFVIAKVELHYSRSTTQVDQVRISDG
jgi:hypothetical protein